MIIWIYTENSLNGLLNIIAVYDDIVVRSRNCLCLCEG